MRTRADCLASFRRNAAALCARDDFANLNARNRDRFRDYRAAAEPFGNRASSVLRLEHEHRQPVASVIGSSPVASDEAGAPETAGHYLLPQSLFSNLRVANGDPLTTTACISLLRSRDGAPVYEGRRPPARL